MSTDQAVDVIDPEALKAVIKTAAKRSKKAAKPPVTEESSVPAASAKEAEDEKKKKTTVTDDDDDEDDIPIFSKYNSSNLQQNGHAAGKKPAGKQDESEDSEEDGEQMEMEEMEMEIDDTKPKKMVSEALENVLGELDDKQPVIGSSAGATRASGPTPAKRRKGQPTFGDVKILPPPEPGTPSFNELLLEALSKTTTSNISEQYNSLYENVLKRGLFTQTKDALEVWGVHVEAAKYLVNAGATAGAGAAEIMAITTQKIELPAVPPIGVKSEKPGEASYLELLTGVSAWVHVHTTIMTALTRLTEACTRHVRGPFTFTRHDPTWWRGASICLNLCGLGRGSRDGTLPEEAAAVVVVATPPPSSPTAKKTNKRRAPSKSVEDGKATGAPRKKRRAITVPTLSAEAMELVVTTLRGLISGGAISMREWQKEDVALFLAALQENAEYREQLKKGVASSPVVIKGVASSPVVISENFLMAMLVAVGPEYQGAPSNILRATVALFLMGLRIQLAIQSKPEPWKDAIKYIVAAIRAGKGSAPATLKTNYSMSDEKFNAIKTLVQKYGQYAALIEDYPGLAALPSSVFIANKIMVPANSIALRKYLETTLTKSELGLLKACNFVYKGESSCVAGGEVIKKITTSRDASYEQIMQQLKNFGDIIKINTLRKIQAKRKITETGEQKKGKKEDKPVPVTVEDEDDNNNQREEEEGKEAEEGGVDEKITVAEESESGNEVDETMDGDSSNKKQKEVVAAAAAATTTTTTKKSMKDAEASDSVGEELTW